jgi:hypothetical protein
MSDSVLAFVLAAMNQLAPGRDHAVLAAAIARVVDTEDALLRGDDSRRRTAALVVAVAYRESGFRNEAKSTTNDHCALQINGRPDLASDPDACVRTGVAMLRQSMRICPAHPIAFYAAGPIGCSDARAQRISRDRMAIAGYLVAKVRPCDRKTRETVSPSQPAPSPQSLTLCEASRAIVP